MKLLSSILLVVASCVVQAQRGIVTGPARTLMTQEWKTTPSSPERLFCVTRWGIDNYQTVVILEVQDAFDQQGTPGSITGRCPDPSAHTIHTHPPATCVVTRDNSDYDPKRCSPGGTDAWLCDPSPLDYATLLQLHSPFGAVQCDANAFVFFYAVGFAKNFATALHDSTLYLDAGVTKDSTSPHSRDPRGTGRRAANPPRRTKSRHPL
jgi:hypothetical protein